MFRDIDVLFVISKTSPSEIMWCVGVKYYYVNWYLFYSPDHTPEYGYGYGFRTRTSILKVTRTPSHTRTKILAVFNPYIIRTLKIEINPYSVIRKSENTRTRSRTRTWWEIFSHNRPRPPYLYSDIFKFTEIRNLYFDEWYWEFISRMCEFSIFVHFSKNTIAIIGFLVTLFRFPSFKAYVMQFVQNLQKRIVFVS